MVIRQCFGKACLLKKSNCKEVWREVGLRSRLSGLVLYSVSVEVQPIGEGSVFV